MPRPDIDVITAVAADCAKSRFATIRDLAEHMNALLAYIGELEAQRDERDEQVNRLSAQLERLEQELADATRAFDDANRHAAELIVRTDRARAEHPPAQLLDENDDPCGFVCGGCLDAYGKQTVPSPCPTIRALDGEPESEATDA
jgi:hypothetical protein